MRSLLIFLTVCITYSSVCYGGFFGDSTALNGPELQCGTNDDVMTENGALTVSFWYYHIDAGGNSNGRFLDRKGVGQVNMFVSGSSPFGIDFQVAGVTALDRQTGNFLILNKWQHICLTWDGSTTAANVKIYFNGIESPSYVTTTNGSTITDNSTGTLLIGNTGIPGIRTLGGIISDVGIWNSVLPLSAIRQLAFSRVKGMPLQISQKTLKRYFPLDDTTHLTSFAFATDRGPLGVNCVPSNNPVQRSEAVLSYP